MVAPELYSLNRVDRKEDGVSGRMEGAYRTRQLGSRQTCARVTSCVCPVSTQELLMANPCLGNPGSGGNKGNARSAWGGCTYRLLFVLLSHTG